MARYFIVTGESSGDKLGGQLARELIQSGHIVSGWGGDEMRSAGVAISQSIDVLRVMGFTDVFKKLPNLIGLFAKCKKDIELFNPDKLILIDFGTFNLKIAKWARSKSIRVIYYSPPKVWASRPSRIKRLKAYCDQVIVLFQFEKEYFEKHGLRVEYYGHPLFEKIRSHTPISNFKERNGIDDRPIISILPGSRSAEIMRTLPTYLSAIEVFDEFQICVSVAPGKENLIKSICNEHISSPVIIIDTLYDLLYNTEIALVTSGTASIETALFGVPQIVGYKTSLTNYIVAKFMINVKFISLVNLIAGKEIVKELIQNDLKIDKIRTNIIRLTQPEIKSNIAKEYQNVIETMSGEDIVNKTVVAITS